MPEQRTLKEANAALDELVQEISRIQGAEDEVRGLVTDYVLIYTSQSLDDDGDTMTALGYAYSGGSQPTYRTLGLLDCMRALLHKRYTENDD